MMAKNRINTIVMHMLTLNENLEGPLEGKSAFKLQQTMLQ